LSPIAEWRSARSIGATHRGPGGKLIVIDPLLTQNPGAPETLKNRDALGKVDLLAVTHAHGDHLGHAPEIAKKNKAPLYSTAGLNQSAMTLGVLPAELAARMDKSGTIQLPGPGIKITIVPAKHSPVLVWKDRATGQDERTSTASRPASSPGSKAVSRTSVTWATRACSANETDQRVLQARPDQGPIGGHFVIDPENTAFAARERLKPKLAIPIHYGTFPPLRAT